MTDPITDMLNQIKNAQAVGKTEVLIPLSNIKNEISSILTKEGFVGEVKKTTRGKIKILKGSQYNIKITNPEDMVFAKAILKSCKL